MNRWCGIGRLTKDPELKSTQNGISVCSFTLAVDRRFKNGDGEREADFIQIVAWRQTAEFIAKYFFKGLRVAVQGSIQTRNYEDKDGKRVYVTEVVADSVYFADSKQEHSQQKHYSSTTQSQPDVQHGFFDEPDDDTALPFDL